MDRSILLIVIAMLIGVIGQLCLKIGMNRVGNIEPLVLARVVEIGRAIFAEPLVWIGLACYGTSALFWLLVLSRFDLSYAYPMLASMYIILPLLSRIFLKESIPPLRWLGMFVVLVGVVLVSRG